MAEWDESKHPRAEDGKFGGAGGATAPKERSARATAAARAARAKAGARGRATPPAPSAPPSAPAPKAKPAPKAAKGAKFDAKPHEKAIAKFRTQEAKLRTQSIAIKAKMAALKAEARAKAKTPAQKARYKARFEKLAAKRDELKSKADAAKAGRNEARQTMQAARAEHAAQRKATREAAKAERATAKEKAKALKEYRDRLGKAPGEDAAKPTPEPAAPAAPTTDSTPAAAAAAKPKTRPDPLQRKINKFLKDQEQRDQPDKVFAANGVTPRIDDSGSEVELKISDRGGQAGRLRMVRGNDGQYRLSHVAIDVEELKGKGVGAAMYRAMASYLKKTHGKPLLSDYSRSPSAERVWHKLVREGLAKPVYERGDSPDGPPSYYVMDGAP